MKTSSLLWVAAIACVLLAATWLTHPQRIDATGIPAHAADTANGEQLFWVGGCANCHATPLDGKRARGDARLLLGGGLELETPYGVFRVPNISPSDESGIGAWSAADFINAMQRGVSPTGRHYYPSFPYTSYARMHVTDILDLKAYLDTLPVSENSVADHALTFPWSLRRGIGAWKRRYLSTEPVQSVPADDALLRGRYLVEGAGHCGECHSPRDRFGGLRKDHWLAGAANLDGDGRIPNITPAGKNVSTWSTGDFVYYFESGFTPDFDTVGGSMVAVQESLAQLPTPDLEAIALYLQSVTPSTGLESE